MGPDSTATPEVIELRRVLSLLVLVTLTASGCATDGEADTRSEAAPTPTPVSELTTTTTTTTPQITLAPPVTTTTLVDVADLQVGLFCRDLQPIGYSYSEVVAYWIREGRPDRMDEDKNGIPCETLYPFTDVIAFWGDPLPTTSPAAVLTLADVEQAASDMWPYQVSSQWTCSMETSGELRPGAIFKCIPDPVPAEGQHAVLTGLVLDDTGLISFAESGVQFIILNPAVMKADLDSGQFCRDILASTEFERELSDQQFAYFGALLYWFLEGRPDRMDTDGNGVPCETLFPAWVVDLVWEGGLVRGYAAG